jgi:protein SCO1
MRRTAGLLSASGHALQRRRPSWTGAAALLVMAMCGGAAGHEPSAGGVPDFVPPSPGTYRLQVIMDVPGGRVLDVDGTPRSLSRFTTGKITLLSFMYTRCIDPKGCPLAYQVMADLKARLDADPLRRDKIRFVSLSFDPQRDSPQAMKLYGSHVNAGRGLQWFFLTPASRRQLQPLLDGFAQDVSPSRDDASGQRTGNLSHVLKVFLLDRRGRVREIYSTSFLVPQVVLNDIETLLLETD